MAKRKSGANQNFETDKGQSVHPEWETMETGIYPADATKKLRSMPLLKRAKAQMWKGRRCA